MQNKEATENGNSRITMSIMGIMKRMELHKTELKKC